jgi:hypothetical protein
MRKMLELAVCNWLHLYEIFRKFPLLPTKEENIKNKLLPLVYPLRSDQGGQNFAAKYLVIFGTEFFLFTITQKKEKPADF